MAIKAIETVYKGYRFRSRLEARWAVFFDALGVPWEYEPEGFDLGNGMWYLPDFRLKCWGTRGSIKDEPFDLYVEVKGKMTSEDADKIKRFSGFDQTYPPQNGEDVRGLNSVLVVGNIPDFNGNKYYADSDQLGSYECMDGISISPWNYELIDGDYFACFPAATTDGRFYLDGDDYNYQTMPSTKVHRAFEIARQARFEHGECG